MSNVWPLLNNNLILSANAETVNFGNGLVSKTTIVSDDSQNQTAISQENSNESQSEVASQNQTAALGSEEGAVAQKSFLSLQVIADHKATNDCWMVISGKVYDFTDYLPNHPGGSSSLLPYCGKDATVAFNTKDSNPPKPHSQYAKSLLDQYYIGTAGQEIAGSQAPTQTAQTNSPVALISTSKTISNILILVGMVE